MSLRSLMRAPSSASSNLRRSFSTSPRHASVFFALSRLSNSRETQHFKNLSRLPRVEHSPPLKLIKTGEVDANPLPTPEPELHAPLFRSSETARSAATIWDEKALKLGRAILADNARHAARLQKALDRAKRREAKREATMKEDRTAWQDEAEKLRSEVRVASAWIVLSIGTATALATWRYWPQRGAAASDSHERAGTIAEQLQDAATPFPTPINASGESLGVGSAAVNKTAPFPFTPARAGEPALVSTPIASAPVHAHQKDNWTSRFFWRSG